MKFILKKKLFLGKYCNHLHLPFASIQKFLKNIYKYVIS